MNTKPKRQVTVVSAVKLQCVGVFKLRWIAVGRADAQGDQRARRQIHPAHMASIHSSPVAQLIG